MKTLTCPANSGPQGRPVVCGADATILEVHTRTGEFTAWCGVHKPDVTPGFTVVATLGSLHSTSLFTTTD